MSSEVITINCVLLTFLFLYVQGYNDVLRHNEIYFLGNGTSPAYNHEVSLTTAKTRISTFPKPTTLYRRIYVEKNIFEVSTSRNLLDLYRYFEARRKRGSKISYIWNWDHWCHLQPRTGNCQDTLNRFYYDAQMDRCQPFIYTGCDGNKNNFDTLLDCEQHCTGAINVKIDDLVKPEFCFLQPNRGFCLALISKYYYDTNEKKCKHFYYGGCGGNQNRFRSLSSCMKVCGRLT